MSPITGWAGFAPRLLSVLRIVAAFLFLLSGTTKLFGFPAPAPGGYVPPFLSQIWIGAWMEVAGGALLMLGLLTRPVAFLLAGEMAVAYFQFHGPKSFWPTINGGVPAALFSFLWLYLSAAGPGSWSLDAMRSRSGSNPNS